MSKTKLKIINKAVEILNEKGVSNVSLMNIAKAAGMSQGNLNYHFKHKSDLMKAIHQTMVNEMEGVIRPMGLVGLEHFQIASLHFFQFQEKYRFFFLDTIEIARIYPEIMAKHTAIISRRMDEGRALLNYYIGGGWLIPEPEIGIYDVIIQQVWFINTFWLGMKNMMKHDEKYTTAFIMNMLWTQLKPYFTEKGRTDFEKISVLKY